ETSKFRGARDASAGSFVYGEVEMPVKWDQSTPVPTNAPSPAEGTERTPTFEPADFGEGESERTVVTNTGFDLKARYTGRAGAIARLQELADKAFEARELAFALITADTVLGKNRIVSELA